MRLNTGIITDKLEETKSFYGQVGFSILWEADWFILLATQTEQTQFPLSTESSTQELLNFRKPFNGNGIYLTMKLKMLIYILKNLKRKN
ncbi:MAG: hypothetical protein IPH31_25650 [Lewinellaceae bacterium]|nr:hypothetical protein [Lewinellaceae bacterium]